MKMRMFLVLALVMLFLSESALASGYTDNGNDTITDTGTGMMWQKQDDGTTRTWDGALTYCEGLSLGGQSDWRLPNIKELRSIVDNTTYSPQINITYFPNTKSDFYWSSTTGAGSALDAWTVGFMDGYTGVFSYPKTNSYYVRCVR